MRDISRHAAIAAIAISLSLSRRLHAVIGGDAATSHESIASQRNRPAYSPGLPAASPASESNASRRGMPALSVSERSAQRNK